MVFQKKNSESEGAGRNMTGAWSNSP